MTYQIILRNGHDNFGYVELLSRIVVVLVIRHNYCSIEGYSRSCYQEGFVYFRMDCIFGDYFWALQTNL